MAAVGSATAYHFTYSERYAGPKTWLSGWSADGAYYEDGNRWYTNAMNDINPSTGCARVALIDTLGRWRRSADGCGPGIGIIEGDYVYTKKPFCKNVGIVTFTASCDGTRTVGHG